MLSQRSHGLDILRSLAIIGVFFAHYSMLTGHLEVIGASGRIGVDLFFVLSGYLISNQIFTLLVKHRPFVLSTFYLRRFLRTVPNYLFVIALYFLLPGFSEHPITTPLWKFLTFTQNINLQSSGFSNAWSLSVEEQFYFTLPLIALWVAHKKSIRLGWSLVACILLAGLLLRTFFWFRYVQNAGGDVSAMHATYIYYPTICRLDSLVMGVGLAMLKNFHPVLWEKTTHHGNRFFILGLLGTAITCYLFQDATTLEASVWGYFIAACSFSALTLAALSSSTWFYHFRVPGATLLAILSYAIYLTHKPLIHLINMFLSTTMWGGSNMVLLPLSILVSFIGGGLLYMFVEKPFLKLRDKMTQSSSYVMSQAT
jgi:peptidoglycan/LPS O-acetylase OafA/YrhL